MSDFDLGLTIRADGSQAIAAGDQFAGSMDRVAAAQKKVEGGNRGQAASAAEAARGAKDAKAANDQHSASLDTLSGKLDEAKAATGAAASSNAGLAASSARLAAAEAALAVAHDKVAAAADKDAAAQNRAAAALAGAQARVAAAAAGVERAQKGSTAAHNDNAAAMNRNAFGARNLGQQVGDFATQVSLGGSVVQAFSAQVGQAGFAMSEMGGKVGAVGRFLTGPWGVALTVASLVLAPFVQKLVDGAFGADDLTDALGKTAFATSAFGNAQSILGNTIDLTTGKIKNQSVELLALARAQALAGQIESRARAAKAREQLEARRNESGLSFAQAASGATNRRGGSMAAMGTDGEVTSRSGTAMVTNALLNGTITSDSAVKRLDVLRAKGKITERQFLDLGRAVTTLGVENENINIYKNLEKALNGDQKAVKGFLNETKARTSRKPPKPKSTESRDEFGRDAQNTIRSMLSQYDETPSLVREVNNQVAKLDDLIDDLQRKKPPNFEKLIADAREAQGVIRNGLNKPYADFIAEQGRAIENTRLIAAGRTNEAEAARVIYSLERQMGPLSDARKAAVLATVDAMKAEERQADILREKQEKYLTALGQIKSAVKGVVTDGLGGIVDLPKRLVASFAQLKSDEIFESLFGDVFRELEDEVKGTNIVEDASTRMSEAIEGTITPLDRLADAADRAADGVGGARPGPSVLPGGSDPVANALASGNVKGAVGALLSSQVVGNLGTPGLPGGAPANDNQGGDIVVNGRRSIRAQELFSKSVEKISKGIGISDEGAKKIGTIGGKAIAGAATGTAVDSLLKPLGKALGFKTSKTGAQIGGAVGSFLPIPFGREIGAVVGSVVGGLFKKTKSGSATIGNVNGEGAITGTGGNSSSYKKAASGLADSIIGSLDNVVDSLGGSLGNFSVSVGKRKKKFVVDPTGSGKTKGGGTQKFDSEEEAIAAALADAIRDGAVTGISAAMQRALSSTTDVDKAVREALKVQQVEELIGGIGGTLQRTFRDFDKSAAEYVATARKYGLNVLAVETETAKARAELVEKTLSDQVGSLRDFLDNLRYGDLAEGSPVDQRQVLLGKISSVQTDAEAGKAGAADELAQLYQRLITQDRETYGTAGPEYSGDRAMAERNVQRVIDMATQRVNEAAASNASTVAAINQGNALANENNALVAQLVTKFDNIPSMVAALMGGGAAKGVNFAATARAAA